MMRVIVAPAVLPPEALAELKEWLGITTTRDDAPLQALLAAALDMCGQFTGLVPLVCQAEEMVQLVPAPGAMPPLAEWQRRHFPEDWHLCHGQMPDWLTLSTRPVLGVQAVLGVDSAGARTAFDTGAYTLRLDAEGGCAVKFHDRAGFSRAVVQFSAGLAADWPSLPDPLRHGILRLAAHQHRTREGAGADALPPASVAALWRPWRRARLV